VFNDTSRAEWQYLLACARNWVENPNSTSAVPAPKAALDWTLVVEGAMVHGLISAVRRQFELAGSGAVDESARRRVERLFQAQRRGNLSMTAELLELLAHFAKRGIRVLPFKGPTLASLLYGDVSARKFSDLDLLVFEADAGPALALLRELGYGAMRELTAAAEPACLKLSSALSFLHARNKTMVDLHWQIRQSSFETPGPAFDTAELWARSEPTRLWGHELASVARDDLLLLLAEHGAKHLFTRLEWLCDVSRLLSIGGAWDFPALLARARANQCLRSLGLALLLSAELLNAPVPASVLAASVDATVRRLKDTVLASISIGSVGLPPVLRAAGFRLRLLDRNVDKLTVLLRAGFQPTFEDWKRWPVPLVASPLLAALRPLRLLAKYAPLVQRAGGSVNSKQPRASSSPTK
jgi:hypothetical protein